MSQPTGSFPSFKENVFHISGQINGKEISEDKKKEIRSALAEIEKTNLAPQLSHGGLQAKYKIKQKTLQTESGEKIQDVSSQVDQIFKGVVGEISIEIEVKAPSMQDILLRGSEREQAFIAKIETALRQLEDPKVQNKLKEEGYTTAEIDQLRKGYQTLLKETIDYKKILETPYKEEGKHASLILEHYKKVNKALEPIILQELRLGEIFTSKPLWFYKLNDPSQELFQVLAESEGLLSKSTQETFVAANQEAKVFSKEMEKKQIAQRKFIEVATTERTFVDNLSRIAGYYTNKHKELVEAFQEEGISELEVEYLFAPFEEAAKKSKELFNPLATVEKRALKGDLKGAAETYALAIQTLFPAYCEVMGKISARTNSLNLLEPQGTKRDEEKPYATAYKKFVSGVGSPANKTSIDLGGDFILAVQRPLRHDLFVGELAKSIEGNQEAQAPKPLTEAYKTLKQATDRMNQAVGNWTSLISSDYRFLKNPALQEKLKEKKISPNFSNLFLKLTKNTQTFFFLFKQV